MEVASEKYRRRMAKRLKGTMRNVMLKCKTKGTKDRTMQCTSEDSMNGGG